jgi:hypothetical protein
MFLRRKIGPDYDAQSGICLQRRGAWSRIVAEVGELRIVLDIAVIQKCKP